MTKSITYDEYREMIEAQYEHRNRTRTPTVPITDPSADATFAEVLAAAQAYRLASRDPHGRWRELSSALWHAAPHATAAQRRAACERVLGPEPVPPARRAPRPRTKPAEAQDPAEIERKRTERREARRAWKLRQGLPVRQERWRDG